MPTQTFYNLPAEKRDKLLNAIHAEFSRVPYDDVSINQIVRAAGIPRGSFYQYFENKQDLLEYLLSGYRQRVEHRARQSLIDSGGDLFQMFLDLLDYTFAFVTEEAGSAFFRNLLADVRHNTDFFYASKNMRPYDYFAPRLLRHVDVSLLDIRGPDDLDHMLGILIPITGDAFSQVFYDTSGYAEMRARYAAKLDILRRGFFKDKTQIEKEG